MASRLAEETLFDILRQCIMLTPDRMQLQGVSTSPSSQDPDSAQERARKGRPGVLLVCKRWLRVGTPLFYQTIVLPRKGHLTRLTRTLGNNPELGKLVRNLCLGHGCVYGKPLKAICQYLTNVDSLSVQADVLSKQKCFGLSHLLTICLASGGAEMPSLKIFSANTSIVEDLFDKNALSNPNLEKVRCYGSREEFDQLMWGDWDAWEIPKRVSGKVRELIVWGNN